MAPNAPAAAPIEVTSQMAEQMAHEARDTAIDAANTVGDIKTQYTAVTSAILNELDPASVTTTIDTQAAEIVQRAEDTQSIDAYFAELDGQQPAEKQSMNTDQLDTYFTRFASEIEEAVRGREGATLLREDPRILGRNFVGGGDSQMQLSADMYKRLDGTRQQIEQIDLVFAHEHAHGEQGDAPLLWLEGHAEIRANEGTGKAASYRRSGQPAALYGEGQTVVLTAVDVIGRDKVEQGMTGEFRVIVSELMKADDPRAQELLGGISADSPQMFAQGPA